MVFYIKLYLVTLAAFLIIDMIWLGLIAKGFYRKHLGFLMLEKPNWTAAIIFYLLFIAGLLVFVISPGLEAHSVGKTLLLAAFFGMITYATYDLTNLATLKNWPVIVTIVDMIWGAILSVLVSLISYYAGNWLR